jgi:hypothetical protein
MVRLSPIGMMTHPQEEISMGMCKMETVTSMGTAAVYQSGLKCAYSTQTACLCVINGREGFLGETRKKTATNLPRKLKLSRVDLLRGR